MSGKFAMMIRAKAAHFGVVTGNTTIYPEDDGVKIPFGADPDLKSNLKFTLDRNTKTL